MNIVLTSVHINKSPDAIPLAPALLKTYFEKYSPYKQVNISIYEAYVSDEVSRVAKEIVSKSPDVLGLSIYLWNRDFYLSLVKVLKSINNKLIIIAGGAETRSDYKTLLTNGVDYTVQGEGEEVFLELINSIIEGRDPQTIDGVNDTKGRFISDLNTIPSPILAKSLDISNYDGLLWELSRGCPYSCDFCFESRGAKGVRYYDITRVEDELKDIIKCNVPQVFVLDPTFNKDLKRAKNILRLIKKYNNGTHFHFEIRAELLDREIAELFSEINASLQIGIQSGSDEVLKLVNRRLDRFKFRSKIDFLNESGAIFGLDLIYGLPGDNYEGFKDSMEFILSLQPNHVDIFPLSVLPGTALWDNSKSLNIHFLENPPYTLIDSDTYSKDDMKKSQLLKESCDFIYNRCRSTGWLSQICKEVRVKLTDFIENYNLWSLNKKELVELDDIEIIKYYIKDRYNPKHYELIRDIIGYHTAYSDAVLKEKSITTIPSNKLLNSIPRLSPNATYQEFSYPLLDAFDNGIYNLKDIKQIFRKEGVKVISWFQTGGEVVFDTYTNEIMNFLKFVDGKKSAAKINKNIDKSFLDFAQESGLLLFSLS